MENNTLTTVTGKPVTIPTAMRLTVDRYQQVKRRADREGVKIATLLQRWVDEKLTEGGTDERQPA